MSDAVSPLPGRASASWGPGTFTGALLSQPDLASLDLVALPSIPDVLAAAHDGTVDLGFVAVENSIEGAVTVTVDNLAFETDLLIQREVVMGVQMNLLAPSGVGLAACSGCCPSRRHRPVPVYLRRERPRPRGTRRAEPPSSSPA